MISVKDSNDKEIEKLEYDSNGNLTKVNNNQSIKTLSYDNHNRLIEVQNDGEIVEKNTYNFKGLRVKKDSNSNITNYFYDGDEILLETDEHDNKIARNVYGTKLISRETEDNKWYYRYNGHGDVANILDENEKVLQDYRYDSFGELTSTDTFNENPFKYSGYIYDDESEYYYLQSRMYDPEYGRFIQEDSYLGKIDDPLSLNLYAYCFNNPLIYDDQDGHFPHILGGALIGAAFGVASNFIGDLMDDGKINRGLKSYAREAVIGGAEGALLAATAGASALLGFGVRVGLDMYDTYRYNGKIGARDVARSVAINAISTAGLRKSVKKLASITKVNSVSGSAIKTRVSSLAGKFNIKLGWLDKLKTRTNIPSISTIRTAASNVKSKLSNGVNKIKNSKIFGENILSNNKNNMLKQGEMSALDDLDDLVLKNKTSEAYKGVGNPDWITNKGYKPQPGERTLEGYVKNNADPGVALYTKSPGFNNNNKGVGGQFKRLGAEEHYGLSPHVHQPIRNVTPNGMIFGRTGKTVGVDTLSPSKKDVKQLYEYINNGNIMTRRIFMTKEQIEFLKELESIQYYCVNVALCKKEKFSNTEEFLNDVTSEVIYRVMEMLDGYGEHLPKCNIVNTITGEIINDGIQLHDACVEFLENNNINVNKDRV